MKTKRILYVLLALCLGAAILYRITKNAQQGAGGKGGSGGPKGGKNAGAMPPTKVDGIQGLTIELEYSYDKPSASARCFSAS